MKKKLLWKFQNLLIETVMAEPSFSKMAYLSKSELRDLKKKLAWLFVRIFGKFKNKFPELLRCKIRNSIKALSKISPPISIFVSIISITIWNYVDNTWLRRMK